MASPSARAAHSALSAIIPSHLAWLGSCDFIPPCVALHGPKELVDLLREHASPHLHAIGGEYDWRLPERSFGSDDEDDETNAVPDSQPVAGIIYSTWFMNRIAFVPASSVLLFQWESNENFSNVRKFVNEQVRIFRQRNRTRTAFLMVLIFKSSTPLEDDVLLERQIMTLRDDLKLAEDCVVVTPSCRSAQAVERSISQIRENAIAAYSSCIKILKRKRSKLGRHSHIFTLIRYHIKLGFYAFLSHDLNSAKKYLNSAHKDLTETQPSSIFQLIEIRDVGLIVNALTCRLLILSEDQSGAIEQFDRHIRAMSKIKVDDPAAKALRFTLYSWLQQEYITMGLLMQGVLANCLRYVNSAANALMRRMDCSFALPDFEKHYLDQLNELMQKTPFYWGQIQRHDEFDCDNSLSLDLFLLAESEYRQSPNVISLLTVAHNLLLAYPRKRKRQIALSELRIARQLNRDCNYTTALPLFQKSINFFRKEGWRELLVSALLDNRIACISAGMISESIPYTCELIAAASDGSTSALQKELMLHLSRCHDPIDVSSTGIVEISQDSRSISIISQFLPPVALDSVTVFDESGSSFELCRNVTISLQAPLVLQLQLPLQSFAILALQNGCLRVAIHQIPGQVYRRNTSVKVTNLYDSPIVFVQELFPLSLIIEHSKGYGFFTLNCSQENAIVDENTCEPIMFREPVPIPRSDSQLESNNLIKAQLYCLAPGNVQASLKLFGEKVPFFEHEMQWRVMNPLEIVESFLSFSCSNLGPSDPGTTLLHLGNPAVLHMQLRNLSSLPIHVIEVFFDHEPSFFEIKQKPSYDIDQEMKPGDCATLQFAFVPVKLCSSMCPGQIRFNWRRVQSTSIQTFATSVSSCVTVLTPSLFADVLFPDPEELEIGKACSLVIRIQSDLEISTKLHVSIESPKGRFHMIGPIKSTLWVPGKDGVRLEWRLFPLQSGFQPLPSIKIMDDAGRNLLSDKQLPNVFIRNCQIDERIT